VAPSSACSDNLSSLILREGRQSDCIVLAELINESAEGAIDYLLFNPNEHSSPIDVVSNLLKQEVYCSYENPVDAELEGKVTGIVLSVPADGLMISEQMNNYYTKEKLGYIRYFVEIKLVDCWHFDTL